MNARLTLPITALLVLTPSVAFATTLTVGPSEMYPTITAAAAAAQDNDIIEIDAGTYHDVATFNANGLTVRGVGGRPVFDLTGMSISNGKAIFVSHGADATFENIEFVGASIFDPADPTMGDHNGAGIRWEGGGVFTVRNCVFRSNENGILGGAIAGASAVVESNEFVDNGRGRVGYTHSVYFGEVDSVMFRGNWSHALWPDGGDAGHLFKSRARNNYVLYNRLTSETGLSSYEVNIPEGGDAYVIGNLIEQRAGSQRIMISFGDGDGTQYTGSHLYVVNNTIANDSTGSATFVRTSQTDAEIHVVNNLLVGMGTVTSGGVVTTMNNVAMDTPTGFVDYANYDYHLVAGSPAINAGIDPGTVGAMSLNPVSEYMHPRAITPRGIAGAIDVGAYEFGATVPDGGVVMTDAGTVLDSGTTMRDASAGDTGGMRADAGSTPRDGAASDAHTATADGSNPGADGGNPGVDGGTGGTDRGGCGCRTAGTGGTRGTTGSALGLAAMATVLAASRRRRTTPRG